MDNYIEILRFYNAIYIFVIFLINPLLLVTESVSQFFILVTQYLTVGFVIVLWAVLQDAFNQDTVC